MCVCLFSEMVYIILQIGKIKERRVRGGVFFQMFAYVGSSRDVVVELNE